MVGSSCKVIFGIRHVLCVSVYKMCVQFVGTWFVIQNSTAGRFPLFDVVVEPQWDIFHSCTIRFLCRTILLMGLCSWMTCRAADGEMSSYCVLNRFFGSIDSSLTRVVAVAAVYWPLHVLILFNKRAWTLSLSPYHVMCIFWSLFSLTGCRPNDK